MANLKIKINQDDLDETIKKAKQLENILQNVNKEIALLKSELKIR